MQLFGMTDKGSTRHENQDFFIINKLSDTTAFAILCDGMGGANAGDKASKMACESISDYIKGSVRKGLTSLQIENIIRSAIENANSKIYNESMSDINYKGMGTTVVVLYIEDTTAYIFHIGDSRAYLFDKNKLTQITTDHSLVQTMVESGQITEEEAKTHPNKNIITRAMGISDNVLCDLDIVELDKDKTLLLCSDGLSNYAEHKALEEEMTVFDEKLPERLIALANSGGGGDNITVVTVKL